MRVPFVDLAAQEETAAADVLAAIAEVGRDARFILGPRVEAFERWLAESCGVAHAVWTVKLVDSGTALLHPPLE